MVGPSLLLYLIYLAGSRVVSKLTTLSQAGQVIESHPRVKSLLIPWLAEAAVRIVRPEGLQLVPVVRREVGSQPYALITRAKLVKLTIQILEARQDTEVDIKHHQSGQAGEGLVIERSKVEQVVGIFLVVLTVNNPHVGVRLHRLDQLPLLPHEIIDVHKGKLYSG